MIHAFAYIASQYIAFQSLGMVEQHPFSFYTLMQAEMNMGEINKGTRVVERVLV